MMPAVVRGRGELLDALRQPAQPEQEQHRGDRLYDQLRQREVRRGQPNEADASHQTRAAEQNERRKTMEFGLVSRSQSARLSRQPRPVRTRNQMLPVLSLWSPTPRA